MAVRITDEWLAPGSWSVDIDYRPTIRAKLLDSDGQPRKLHLLAYDADSNLLYVGILLSAPGGKGGITIGGMGPLWHLGVAGVGPTIPFAEYLSNANKLSNPLDPANPLDPPDLYWVVGDSVWVIGAGFATTSSITDNTEDQLLAYDEKFPVVVMETYESTVTIGRISGYTLGRLRLRHHYTGGPFVHADQLPAFSTWDPSTGTSLGQNDITYDAGTDAFLVGPSAMPNLVEDGEFDVGPGGADWTETGTWDQGTDGGWNGANYAFNDNSGFELLVSDHPLSVVEGEQYEMRHVVRTNPGSPATIAETFMQVAIADGGPVYARIDSERFVSPGATTDWNIFRKTFEIPEGHVSMTPLVITETATPGGRIDIDTVTIIRTKGNLDFVTSPIFAITPGRSYRWVQPVVTAAGVREGTVSLAIVCFVATRPEVIIQGPSVRVTGGSAEVVEWEFTPPSGMDVCMARIVCQDVVGGTVSLLQEGASIRQSDTSSMVLEEIGPLVAPVDEDLTVTSVAPAGAQDVHLEIVAEANGIGWVTSGYTLIRVATPDTGDDVVADLLTQPETGDPLSLAPGTIVCPEDVPYDVTFVQVTNIEGLHRFARIISEPAKEYRVEPGLPPTLDVATTIGTDHAYGSGSPVILVPEAKDVDELTDPDNDATERPTHVHVLGGVRRTVSGQPLQIEATAAVPGDVELDWNERPYIRTERVSDSTVDHFAYARALATDLANQAATPPLAISVRLSGTDRPSAPPGDTVYVYAPESGIEDLDNPVPYEGETVFPRGLRVISRTREVGPSHRLYMREPDGTTWELEGAIFGPDQTTLVVGDRRPPEAGIDSQGGATGLQYLRDRTARP